MRVLLVIRYKCKCRWHSRSISIRKVHRVFVTTLWDFFLSCLYRKIRNIIFLTTTDVQVWTVRCIFFLGDVLQVFCSYLTYLEKYSMNVTLDDFPLLVSVCTTHQGICTYLQDENVSSILCWIFFDHKPSLPFFLLIRLHYSLISAFDFKNLKKEISCWLSFFINNTVTSARATKGGTLFA